MTSNANVQTAIRAVEPEGQSTGRELPLLRRMLSHTGTPPTSAPVTCRWNVDDVTATIRITDAPGPAADQHSSQILVLDAARHGFADIDLDVWNQGGRSPRLCFVDGLHHDANQAALSWAGSLRRHVATARPLHVQVPLYLHGDSSAGGFRGVFDLIRWKASIWPAHGGNGRCEIIGADDLDDIHAVPDGFWDDARRGRNDTEDMLRGRDTEIEKGQDRGEPLDGLLDAAIGRLISSRSAEPSFVPVLYGSSAENIGIQPLLDAIVRYLPAPPAR